MRKLHVFVNRNGEVVATGPAPDEVNKATKGPVFVGFAPAEDDSSFTAYEITIEDDLQLGRADDRIEEYHKRIAERIRTTANLKQVDFRKFVNSQK